MRDDIKWAVDYIRLTSPVVDLPNVNHGIVNEVLYYADFLAVRDLNRHITWCSYMNIGGFPKCVALIMEDKVDLGTPTITPSREPFTALLRQAIDEVILVMQGGGWDALKEFIANICNIVGQPKVTPEHMFYYATVTKDKWEKRALHKEFMKDKEQRDSEYSTTYIDPEFEEEVTVYGNKYTSI